MAKQTDNNTSDSPPTTFNIVEASITDHRDALNSGVVTALDLTIAYILRIAHCDVTHGLNAFTLINPDVLAEAKASDEHRCHHHHHPPRALEGIPYTLKDSYKYAGLTVTNGSPALQGLMSNEDSDIAGKLRAAGAVLLGKTNMPPMACGGMQRGLYGRAESPYNSAYLAGAFSSGSSNGAAAATAASLGVFAMGSETVSSGRSPASNNGLVVYTPSKGVLGCRGLWPLYVTCDVPTPMARSVGDLVEVVRVIQEEEGQGSVEGDFWRGQRIVELPLPKETLKLEALKVGALNGTRVGVPKMYVGGEDSNPQAKKTTVNSDVVKLWEKARADLEALGAEVILTDFPLVTNYEDEMICGETNNIIGAPENWSSAERAMVIAKSWDDFLRANNDKKIKTLNDVDTEMFFPKPDGYIPDTFLEVKNLIDYDALPALAEKYKDTSVFELPGMRQAVKALEAQRKRDFEDWLDAEKLDLVVFPAQGDVGKSDLEFNLDSAEHALANGVKYSNGNRAIRHLGVPTVSVPMGIMEQTGMPMNLTFAGKAYDDDKVLTWVYAYEQGSQKRVAPTTTPVLKSDIFDQPAQTVAKQPNGTLTTSVRSSKAEGGRMRVHVEAEIEVSVDDGGVSVDVYLNGEEMSAAKVGQKQWEVDKDFVSKEAERLDWSLKSMSPRPVMVLVVLRMHGLTLDAELLWTKPEL